MNAKNHTVSPAFQKLSPPIIVIGMHRSGTSMLSGILHILGVYMDPEFPTSKEDHHLDKPNDLTRQNGYGEATCFRLLNEEVMAQSGADWFHID